MRRTMEKDKSKEKIRIVNKDFYSCLCGFKTKSLADLRRHFTLGKKEPGKHKSLGTKPNHPLDVPAKGTKKIFKGTKDKKQGESLAVLPSGETVGGYDEIKKPQLRTAPELSGASKEDKEKEKAELITTETRQGEVVLQQKGEERRENIPTIPAEIIGFGLPISVRISVKTLALYQIARAMSGDSLELGDFIDDCVEDVFRGRGQDLGLIKTKV